MSSGGFKVPKGYRYHPSDEELLSDLEKKNHCKDSHITTIPEINVCKYEPHQLPELASTKARNLGMKFFFLFFSWLMMEEETWHSQKKWYFFAPVDHKYTKSSRANRTTGEGSWKITGKDREIKAPGSKLVIGKKRTLTFYKRSTGKPDRTGWVIHEYYHIQGQCDTPKQIGEYVVCCLKYKSDGSDHDKDAAFFNKGSSSCSMASNIENQEMVARVITSDGSEAEAEAVGGMNTDYDDYFTIEELEEGLEDPIGAHDHDFRGKQSDPCCIEQNDHSTAVEPRHDRSNSSDMINELLDNPENLDSLFHPPAPPQLYPQDHSPKNAVDVHKDESPKRAFPFENDDPLVLKKNKISVNNDNNLLGNIACSSENQTANVIPKGDSQPGSDSDLFPPKDTQQSINEKPGDFNDDDVIELDDFMPSYKGINSPLREFSGTFFDECRQVISDDDYYAAFTLGAYAPQ